MLGALICFCYFVFFFFFFFFFSPLATYLDDDALASLGLKAAGLAAARGNIRFAFAHGQDARGGRVCAARAGRGGVALERSQTEE